MRLNMSNDETAKAYQEFRVNGYRTLESIFALLNVDGNFLNKVRAEGIVSPNAKYYPSLEEDRVNDNRIGKTGLKGKIS